MFAAETPGRSCLTTASEQLLKFLKAHPRSVYRGKLGAPMAQGLVLRDFSLRIGEPS